MVDGAEPGARSALEASEFAALRSRGTGRTFPRNARVFHEGDRSDFVVVVVRGRLKIVASTADGGESVLGIRGEGAVVGELAAFDGGPRTASAIAMEPLTVRIVSAEDFRDFVVAHPDVVLELIRMLMGRLREADRRRVEFGSYDATARVARLLCDVCAEHGLDRDGRGRVRLAQHEIAGLVGASRESVARALALFRDREIVSTGRGTVTVLDVEALRHLGG